MSEVLEKRYAFNKVRHAVATKGTNSFGYLLSKIEVFANIRNSNKVNSLEGARQKYFFFEDKTVVRYYTHQEPNGLRGRPALSKFEGEICITDEELLMSNSEFYAICEEEYEIEKDAYEAYQQLKAQFEK
jgi:hypothetical protein